MLCLHDYEESVVACFSHQIQSEYYSGNRYLYIEDIVLENFSAPTHTETETTTQELTHHTVSYSFFLMTAHKMLPQLLHTENPSLNC